MKFLHKHFPAKAKDKIIVTFDKPTTVYLIPHAHFQRYKNGRSFSYMGGKMSKSPAEFIVPKEGVWHAVIEEGTHYNPVKIKGSARLERPVYHTLVGSEEMETHSKVKTEYDDTLE